MWNIFQSKPKSCVGIDIGTSSIKLVQLKRVEGRYKLETYGELQTYGYLERLNDPFQTRSLRMLEDQVIEMTRRVIKEAGVSTKHAVVSIPVFSSFFIVIDTPPMAEKELFQAISFEAKRHIPIPLSEVRVDWKVIEKSKLDSLRSEGKKGLYKFRIILVAVLKEVISKYLRIAQALGLKLLALELENFSYVRSLVGSDQSTVCVLDLGARTTSFTIVDKGFIQASYSLDTAGTELTRALAHGLGVGFKRAELYKKEKGLGYHEVLEEEVKNILLTIVDKITFELERMIKNYQVKTGRKVTKLVLGGGSGNLVGLREYLEKKFKIDIVLGSPWARVSYPSILEPALKEIAPSFAVAVGLAMRDI